MLTTYEQAFCRHYLATGGDGPEAVRLAGYRTAAPDFKASQLLAREDIRLALESALRDALWQAGLTPRYLAECAMTALNAALLPADVQTKPADPKTALELIKLLGKWTGLEDCADRKLNHDAARLLQEASPARAVPAALPALPRPDPAEWERAREIAAEQP